MLVKNWMTRPVVTIDINESMYDAIKLTKKHAIKMLPVLKKNQLVGIITDRDLKKSSASDATTLEVHELLEVVSNIKIADIMTKDPVTVPLNFTVEETAKVLMDKKISGVPVLDDNEDVAGIITQSDIFKALISLTGICDDCIQFAFRLEDRSGSIKEVADIIRNFGGRMTSILSTYENVPAGYRNVYIRFHGFDADKVPEITAAFKKHATILYMVYPSRNKREIFEE